MTLHFLPVMYHPLSPLVCSTQPIIVLSRELTSGVWASAPILCLSIPGCDVQRQCYQWPVWESLLCPPQSSYCILFWDAEVPLFWLISLSVIWIPGCGSLASFASSLRIASPILILFFLSFSLFYFLCSTKLCGGFLARFGGLRSSASIQ